MQLETSRHEPAGQQCHLLLQKKVPLAAPEAVIIGAFQLIGPWQCKQNLET
jgi:hypothetical protein